MATYSASAVTDAQRRKVQRRIGAESALARTRRARRMHRILADLYPEAHCELTHQNPFELLVATVMSAQTTDVQVNRVTPALFAAYPDAAALAGADIDHVQELIRPTGFYKAKARSITSLAAHLVHHFGGQVPRTMAELTTLPGVGRKTANVVLGNAFGVPGITVDTHFGRLARRFGWTTEDDPTRVESIVGEMFPSAEHTELSHRMIFHGRRVCHAKKPGCGACPLAGECPSNGLGETDPMLAERLIKPATAAQRAAAEGARR